MDNDNYKGNIWQCDNCNDQIRRHSVETCGRYGSSNVTLISGTIQDGYGDTTKEKRQTYAKKYYDTVTKAKRAAQ